MSGLTLPAAAFLIGGLLACFAGYRLFRVVLAIYGFIAGALFATSAYDAEGVWILVAAVLGGLAGAVLMIVAYFLGVILIGALAGILVADLIWASLGGMPHWIVLLISGALGAAGAFAVQRIAIILGTALVGAWTTILGALALFGAASAVADGSVPLVYPPGAPPGEGWGLVAWIVLAVVGAVVQFAGGGDGRRV